MIDKRILVHCCCGPCSTSSIERLIKEGYTPVLYFTNDNIYPYEEWEKRYDALLTVAHHYNLEVYKDSYKHDDWIKAIRGLEGEKEGGARCERCFKYNLSQAYLKMKELGISNFCTTLTVSRFKNSNKIFSQGEELEGFVKLDFKKQDGFSRSCILAKELKLYRQSYCGCEFSNLTQK